MMRFFSSLITRTVFFLFAGTALAFASGENRSASDIDTWVPGRMAFGMSAQQIDFVSIESSDAELAFDRTTLDVPFGRYTLFDQLFVPSVNLERFGVRFRNLPQDNKELYTLKIPLVYLNLGQGDWTRVVSIIPSMHSDFDALDEEAFSLMGLVLWKLNITDHSRISLGAGVNQLFGEYKPIPMVAYHYQPNMNWKLDLGFPVTKAEYAFTPKWTTFASLAPVGGNWRYEGVEDTRVNLSYSSWQATLGMRYQFLKKIWMTLETGTAFERQLDLDADSDAQAEVDIDDGQFLKLTLGLHP